MAPTLYMFHGSPAVRSVLVAAKVLNAPLDLNETHELQTPEFLKLNPQHTVPTYVDGGKVIICDSHAINAYLVGKYGKDDSLYPKDLYKRSLVDQRLYFDSGTIFPLMMTVLKPAMKKEIKGVSQAHIEAYNEAYGFMEKFLEGRQWIAVDNITIADFSCYTTLTTLNAIIPVDSKTYPNITNWVQRIQALPYFAEDQKEIQAFKDWYNSLYA